MPTTQLAMSVNNPSFKQLFLLDLLLLIIVPEDKRKQDEKLEMHKEWGLIIETFVIRAHLSI